jgi:hypothetical protein
VWPLPILFSNVMPRGVNTKTATTSDVGSSGQNDVPVNSVTGCPLKQGVFSNNVKPIRGTGEIAKLYILARKVPSYTKNWQNFSSRPLQHDIWCLVLDASTEKIKFMQLCACQDLARSGVDIEDIDWGKGIHPVADKTWMNQLIHEGKWPGYMAKYVASYTVGKRSYCTVLLPDVKMEHWDLLRSVRGVLGYTSDALVRVPCSNIYRVKEQERISVMAEKSEDSAPCQHRVLTNRRRSKGAQSVRKASKPKSKNGRKIG